MGLSLFLSISFHSDEYLNRDFKNALRTGSVSRNTDELLEKAKSFMKCIASLPDHVMAYFRHPADAYAAQGIVFKGRVNSRKPWSVPNTAEAVVAIYAQRMQIEEAFRDRCVIASAWDSIPADPGGKTA